ncbi:hypothetical protein YC2023_002570 [Brassica napus]
MESFAKDNGIELDNLESEFKATSSAPWYIFFGRNLSKEEQECKQGVDHDQSPVSFSVSLSRTSCCGSDM